MNKLIDKLIKEVSENKAKIIDDFTKAYLASRWDNYFSKQKKIDFRRLKLVETRDGLKTTYQFMLTKGKLPNQ